MVWIIAIWLAGCWVFATALFKDIAEYRAPALLGIILLWPLVLLACAVVIGVLTLLGFGVTEHPEHEEAMPSERRDRITPPRP